MLGQVDPERLADACGDAPSFICREVLELTDSGGWARSADALFGVPLRIVLVLAMSMVLRRVVDRAIRRFQASLMGEATATRRIRRRLRGTSLGQRLPDAVLTAPDQGPRAAARAGTLGAVLRSLAGFAIWSIAAITILGELGVNLAPLVASAGVAGLAVGFGAQALVKDFLAGVFILVEDQYGVGDIVDVGDVGGAPVMGAVEEVSLRATRLRSVDGTLWHVPNGMILRVGNKSQKWARALLDVSVAYEADVDLAESIIKATADELWNDSAWQGVILEEPELWGVEDLGADGVTIRLVVKTQPAEQFRVMRELRVRIKRALDAGGVEIPFPQRTVWIRSGEPS